MLKAQAFAGAATDGPAADLNRSARPGTGRFTPTVGRMADTRSLRSPSTSSTRRCSTTSSGGSPRPRWPERELVDDWSQGTRCRTSRTCASTGRASYDWRATGGGAQPVRPVHDRDRRPRPALHPRPLAARERRAADHHPRLARVDRRVPQDHRAADRTRPSSVATPPTRSTSWRRRCPGSGSRASRGTTGWGVGKIAEVFAELMARLGYDRYIAQGGDWGSAVTAAIGATDTDHCIAVHVDAGDGRAARSSTAN